MMTISPPFACFGLFLLQADIFTPSDSFSSIASHTVLFAIQFSLQELPLGSIFEAPG